IYLCFAETVPTDIYDLSLHDALPISQRGPVRLAPPDDPLLPVHRKLLPVVQQHPDAADDGVRTALQPLVRGAGGGGHEDPPLERSEEHTSELQSRENLVCRLLLEKKK